MALMQEMTALVIVVMLEELYHCYHHHHSFSCGKKFIFISQRYERLTMHYT